MMPILFHVSRRFALIMMIVVLTGGLFAQDVESGTAPSDATRFLIYVRSRTERSDTAYASLMGEFLSTQIMALKLKARCIESAEEELPDFGETALQNQLMSIFKRYQGDYAILLLFERTNESVKFDFYCFDLHSATVVVEQKGISTQSLLIDVALADLVSNVVDVLGDDFSYRSVTTASGSLTNSVGAETTSRASAGNTVPAMVQPGTTVATESRRGGLPFRFTGGVGRFFSLGYAARFFRAGTFPSLSLIYNLVGTAGEVGFGLRIGACFLESPDSSASAATALGLIFSPLGASVTFTSTTGSFLDVIIGLQGGASIISVNPEETGYRSKIVPYSAAELGLLFRMTDIVAFRAAVEVLVFFEQRHPVFGYAPSLSVVF